MADWSPAEMSRSGSPIEIGVSPPLVEIRQIKGHLWVTMNHPRTPSFLKATALQQKARYRLIWDDIKNSVNIQEDESSAYIFEYTEKGQIHLHGYITLYGDGHIMGAISDYAKAYKEWLPARHPFKEIYMYPNFQRYRDASLCVQYAEPERLQEWVTYMKKSHFINKNLISQCLFIKDAAKKDN